VYFILDRSSNVSLQNQLREQVIAGVLNGHLPPEHKMPSTRSLAENLGISRSTVVIVYEKLSEEGYLQTQQRSGYRISPLSPNFIAFDPSVLKSSPAKSKMVDWNSRLEQTLAAQRNIKKPCDWRKYEYPFVYGQPDATLFPLADWRECSRQAMSELDMRDWTNDAFMEDDPHLVAEIRTKLLPSRGVFAEEEEILVTLGAQHGLYLVAAALVRPGMSVGVEDPGYPDMRNIFDWHGAHLVPLPVDVEGVEVNHGNAAACSLLYITPSHQYPTTVTLSEDRRQQLLSHASENDQLIIEDDFESETNYTSLPVPALKAFDQEGRVVHVGSLSKSMFPGLRLGYVVAPKPLIREMRLLRRLMIRHAPSNNQRTTSLFIALGYHLTYARQLNVIYAERWQVMQDALNEFLPGMAKTPQFGGTSFWIHGPTGLDADDLAERALQNNVVLEPGPVHFMDPSEGKRYFRLGFSAIDTHKIRTGIKTLSALVGC
jgi:GntR family transcriptional regulator/MocR family aminotransferase